MNLHPKQSASSRPLSAHKKLASALAGVLILAAAAGCGRRPPPETSKTKNESDLRLAGPATVALFHAAEFDVKLPARFRVPPGQEHDAYDADDDGVSFAAHGVFTSGERQMRVPGFMMREGPGAPWKLRVRFMPLAPGRYECRVRVTLQLPDRVEKGITQTLVLDVAPSDETGPLMVPPAGDGNRRYFVRPRGSARAEPFWLLGTTRPWVVANDPEKRFPDEWCDRESEIFRPMRDYGLNTLSMWMAPWELLLVHQKQAEFWPARDDAGRIIDGHFDEHPLDENNGWRPYASYDQGRAAAMDRIVRMAEQYDARSGTHIHLFLAPLPHQCLRVKTNQWDGARDPDEIVFEPEDAERLCGFARLVPNMTWEDFFAARPTAPRGDWRRQLWDHQANFYRYLIARWGPSRALGAWVLLDEVDGVGTGPMLSRRSQATGWWSSPENDAWHDLVLRMFRGSLDGYDGDPYGHPVTSSTTAYDYKTGAEDNGTWIGGETPVDFASYHSYPAHRCYGKWVLRDGEPVYAPLSRRMYPNGIWGWAYSNAQYIRDGQETWARAAQRTHDWAAAIAAPMPKLITEFGYIERPSGEYPARVYGKKYPTVYHYVVWAALASGHAGAPFDWNDGKEFGEMIWRDRPGDFTKDVYPINNYREIANAARFLDGEKLDEYAPIEAPIETGSDAVTCWAMRSQTGRVLGWAFVNRPDADVHGLPRLTITGRPEATVYRVEWFNTWTGERVEVNSTVAGADGHVIVMAPEAFMASVVAPESAPNDFRNNVHDVRDDGKDIAFKLIPIRNPD